jgi:hypothetical protein
MTNRYRVGFPDPRTRSFVTDRNPGMLAVVDTQSFGADTQSFGALGVVVAVCDKQEIADRIVHLLNQFGLVPAGCR